MSDSNSKKYLQLFISTFQISSFTFGGGYVIVPLLSKKFVEDLKWIDEEEMLDIVAIAQSTPGAIAINASLLIGYRIAGIPGALISILGTVIPPFTIISVVSFFYAAFKDNLVIKSIMKTIQPAIAAIIFSVVIDMGSNILKSKKLLSIILMVAAFIANQFLDINILYIILSAGFISLFFNIYEKKKGGAK